MSDALGESLNERARQLLAQTVRAELSELPGHYAGQAGDGRQAMAHTYRTGAFTMEESGREIGVKTVSRAMRKFEGSQGIP